jgi:hypothetical protein
MLVPILLLRDRGPGAHLPPAGGAVRAPAANPLWLSPRDPEKRLPCLPPPSTGTPARLKARQRRRRSRIAVAKGQI